MSNTKNKITVNIPFSAVKLPDNDQWENRMEFCSESSNRVYVVAQNKKKRHFGCSCPGWRIHRNCKHLKAVGLPSHEQPIEVNLV